MGRRYTDSPGKSYVIIFQYLQLRRSGWNSSSSMKLLKPCAGIPRIDIVILNTCWAHIWFGSAIILTDAHRNGGLRRLSNFLYFLVEEVPSLNSVGSSKCILLYNRTSFSNYLLLIVCFRYTRIWSQKILLQKILLMKLNFIDPPVALICVDEPIETIGR